jgi:hypothetical protein
MERATGSTGEGCPGCLEDYDNCDCSHDEGAKGWFLPPHWPVRYWPARFAKRLVPLSTTDDAQGAE